MIQLRKIGDRRSSPSGKKSQSSKPIRAVLKAQRHHPRASEEHLLESSPQVPSIARSAVVKAANETAGNVTFAIVSDGIDKNDYGAASNRRESFSKKRSPAKSLARAFYDRLCNVFGCCRQPDIRKSSFLDRYYSRESVYSSTDGSPYHQGEISGMMVRRTPCRPTFVFDPSGKFYHNWTFVVCLAFLYNLWIIIYRFAFDEIRRANVVKWFALDYSADLIYILDILMNFRTGFLAEGVLQTQPRKMRLHYTNTTRFYLDCLCILPLDFLYLSFGFKSIVRCPRLVKVYKFWSFIEKCERHTSQPNLFRAAVLLNYVVIIFHWNACLVYTLRDHIVTNGSTDRWTNRSSGGSLAWSDEDNFQNYLVAFYLSCKVLTLTETLHLSNAADKGGCTFVIFEQIFGLLIFATVLGHSVNIIWHVSAARKDFQDQLDRVKNYMHLRCVPEHLQVKVIRWFDYLWTTKTTTNEGLIMDGLPDKLKAEIAIHVHLETLKQVEIFRDTEPGFLCALVLRLRPMLFSPGDCVCRKGEVGKEMYIISRGILKVLTDDGRSVLATLKAGGYFGEISILNLGPDGNRRTASVVSVGYSDLFCLEKKDIWEVLEDYPLARTRLETIAQQRLEQKRAEEAKAELMKDVREQTDTAPCQRPTVSASDQIEYRRANSAPASDIESGKQFVQAKRREPRLRLYPQFSKASVMPRIIGNADGDWKSAANAPSEDLSDESRMAQALNSKDESVI